MKTLKELLKESILDSESTIVNNQDVVKEQINNIINKYFNVYGRQNPIKIIITNNKPIVNIDGDICLNNDGMELRYLPTEFKFGKVAGVFELSWGELETLEGCPEEVGGLICDEMPRLKTLKGSPKIIKGNWQLTNCKNLKSLDCDTKEVGKSFNCHNCKNLPKNSTIKANVKGEIRINL